MMMTLIENVFYLKDKRGFMITHPNLFSFLLLLIIAVIYSFSIIFLPRLLTNTIYISLILIIRSPSVSPEPHLYAYEICKDLFFFVFIECANVGMLVGMISQFPQNNDIFRFNQQGQ